MRYISYHIPVDCIILWFGLFVALRYGRPSNQRTPCSLGLILGCCSFSLGSAASNAFDVFFFFSDVSLDFLVRLPIFFFLPVFFLPPPAFFSRWRANAHAEAEARPGLREALGYHRGALRMISRGWLPSLHHAVIFIAAAAAAADVVFAEYIFSVDDVCEGRRESSSPPRMMVY